MKLLSICVGLPREIDWKGKPVRTFKTPVTGRIPVTKLNLRGDQQSDLSVHGGIDKAVYAYPSEHYAFWREQLPRVDLPWGAFGENFTTDSRNLVGATPRANLQAATLTLPSDTLAKLEALGTK